MRVLVCGSREWNDPTPIMAVLDGMRLREGPPVLIHGACRGADDLAGRLARGRGNWAIEEYPANWDRDGRGAGHARNQRMLDEAKPEVVFAFKDQFDYTLMRGESEDMVSRSRSAGVPTYVVSHA